MEEDAWLLIQLIITFMCLVWFTFVTATKYIVDMGCKIIFYLKLESSNQKKIMMITITTTRI